MPDAFDALQTQAAAYQQQQATAANQPPAVRPFQEPNEKPQVRATPAVPPPPPSIMDRIAGVGKQALGILGQQASAAGNAYAGTEAGILRAPGQLIGGLTDSLSDAGKFIDSNIQSPFVRGAKAAIGAATGMGPGAIEGAQQATALSPKASLADTLSMRESLGKVGNQGFNQFTTEALPVAAAFLSGQPEAAGPEAAAEASSVTRILGGAGKLLMDSAKVGGATAITSDPRSARISGLIQSAGVHNAVIDYLAGSPDDPALEQRLKSGIEAGIANVPFQGAIMGVAKLIKLAAAGDPAAVAAELRRSTMAPPQTKIVPGTPEEAAADKLDRAFATGRTQEARNQAAEAQNEQELQVQGQGSPQAPAPSSEAEKAPPGQESLSSGTRHTDEPAAPADEGGAKPADPVPATPDHPNTTLATDANAAIEKAGGKETLAPDTMKVTPAGKVVVADSTKDLLDKAGLGRAFDTAEGLNGPEQEIFKEEAPDGSSRVVGMMSKDDLQGFITEATHRADTDDPSLEQINAKTAPETAARVGQWTIGNLGASYDVPAFMRALTDRLKGAVRPLPDEELHTLARNIADQTGLHPDDVLDLGQQYAGNTKDLAVGMQALRTVQSRVLQDLMDLRGLGFSDLPEDHPIIQDALQKVHNAATFASHVEEAKTGIGQALRVQQLPDSDAYLEGVAGRAQSGAPPLPPKVPEQLPLPRNRDELLNWLDQLKAIATTGDASKVQAFLRGKLMVPGKWAYLGTSFPNFFTGAIVSAPKTLVRDLWGPGIIAGVNTLGRTTAGAMMAINPVLSEAARREAWVASWGAARAYTTTLSDVGDAFRSAAKLTGAAFSQGDPILDHYWDPFGSNLPSTHTTLGGGQPIDINAQGVPRVLIDAAMGHNGAGVTGAVPYYLGNAINKFPQAVMALHGGFNDFAQTLAYLGEVRATAYNDAAKLGLQGDDFKQFLQERLLNARDPRGAANDATALDNAQRVTLTRQPGETDPGIMKAAFGAKQWMTKNVPVTRFIMPIFTVPANALGESLRRIPGLGFMLQDSGDALMGRRGVAAQADAYGRQLMGGAALMAGAVLGQSGNLTGAAPTNAADRQAWEGKAADGSMMHQPYSIRVNGTWYSYARTDVVGPLLSIMAAFNDRSIYSPGTQDLGQHALAAAAGLAEYFKDQASLQGLAQVLNFGGDPQESANIFTRVMGTTGSGFVPHFLTQIRDNLDPIERTHHTVGDYIMDAVPGLSQTLDPVRNVLGEPVMLPHSPVFDTLPISMANQVAWDKDPVQDETSRLYETTGEAHGVLPPSLGINSGADMRDIKLEDGRSLYDHLMQARMTSTNGDGNNLRQAMENLYHSDDYKQALDGRSSDRVDADGNPLKGAMVRDTFNEFAKQAKSDVANASPIAARYLAVAHAMNANPQATHGYNAHQLASQPPLLKALGIDIDDYEDVVKSQ